MEKYYNAKEIEARIRGFWEERQIYRFDPDGEGEVYSIDTPPPTVSGSLHIGHIFSYVQAEIIARFRRMYRYRVFYPFGFDDNGLPTERLVERESKIRARDLPRGEFRALCSETARRYESQFAELWNRMGFSCDWSLKYETSGAVATAVSQRSFIELARSGRAYLKEAPSLWCAECRTSVAQAELEAKITDSEFIWIPFASETGILPVATTRPELLGACVCVLVHPEDSRYAGFAGKTVKTPLYGAEVPVFADTDADPDKGSGAVMCCTFGDSADVGWAEKYNLPYIRAILPDGTAEPGLGFRPGTAVKAARLEIIAKLAEAGLIIKREPVRHSVGVHERCGTEIEILPSRQWYIDILKEKRRFAEAADLINWYPPHMKERYLAWVENLKWDWCVSRQRYYGVPIPVWYCAACGKPHFAADCELPADPSEREYFGKCECGCSKFTPETSVLDTWATSSVTPQINARWGMADSRDWLMPMTMRTQAHEIIRTWAFYTIVYHTGRIPWRDIMVCGFVMARKGEKLSKSKQNASLTPEGLLETHSADVIRYWSASARLGTDTFFSETELEISRRFLTKLWNAAKFALPLIEDYEPGPNSGMFPADAWILEKLKQTANRAAALLNEYEIGSARREIDAFFWNDFCDNYLELVKERLYEPERRGFPERRAAQSALCGVLLGVLRLYAPYTPFITEYIYTLLPPRLRAAESVHLLRWDGAISGGGPDGELIEFGEALKSALSDARRIKTERGLSANARLGVLEIACEERFLRYFRASEGDIIACVRADGIEYCTEKDSK